jgi:hypothetical protein
MSSGEAVLWLVGCVIVVALVGHIWRIAQDRAARRARHQRYQLHETRPQRLATRPGTLSGSMGAERAGAIRRSAESAALLASNGHLDNVKNPYPEGTPEFVLWVATFHLAMTELAEQEHADTTEPGVAGEPRVSRP